MSTPPPFPDSGQIFNRHDTKTERFFRVPQTFYYSERYQELSSDAKILYGFYRNRLNLSEKNGWEDENGDNYFLFPQAEIAFYFDWSLEKVRDKVNELIHYNLLIIVKQNGSTAKSYLKKVDGTAKERHFITKKRLIELLNLFLLATKNQGLILKISELEPLFISFILSQEQDCSMEDVVKLFKIHKFDLLFRIADAHLFEISAFLMRQVKRLSLSTKEKSKFRDQTKKEFDNSFRNIFKNLKSKKEDWTLSDFIQQLEFLWMKQNEKAIEMLHDAQKNGKPEKPVSQNLKKVPPEKAQFNAEKNGKPENLVSGNQKNQFAQTRKSAPSKTDFNNTDFSKEDEAIKGKHFFKSKIKEILEGRFAFVLEPEIKAEIIDEQLVPLIAVFDEIDQMNLKNAEQGELTKQELVDECEAKVPNLVENFRAAKDYTRGHCLFPKSYDQYMTGHLQILREKQEIERAEAAATAARITNFYIPMDGPWV
ncbi:hypothetical protein GHI93_00335 [Lactococcus hircilactis]|uniref:Replication initiator A N-terminal domain-containing protein n=1 Tax=Lactococcus hircilactis TaxID=1494462 RepID=A0A7X1Z6D3_9LACT|nr:replication initiator protein A [Lactococcus hircilactis]MQW38398.1 hypothetical protein [Lactococcus hircilactis]